MNEIEIEKQKLKLLKKLISIASDLDLVLAVEDSIKIGNNISKFNQTRYFLINKEFESISQNKISTKNKEYIEVINKKIDNIKNKLNIKELPNIKNNKPITEFIYSKNFEDNSTQISLGFFQTNYQINLLEFNKNTKKNTTFYFKDINNTNIFKKYDLLKPYEFFFNYKNFNKYFLSKENDEITQIGLLYYNIKIKDFIPFFTILCTHFNWNNYELLNILNENKDNFLSYIIFHKNYITIHYFIE